MVNTTYRIPFLVSDDLETWLYAQTNRVGGITRGNGYTEIIYNHDATQKANFLKELYKRCLVTVDSAADNPIKYDSEIYSVSNPPPSSGASETPREEMVAMWDVSRAAWVNIGSTFVDVYLQANADGKSVMIDTTGKTQVRLVVLWNKIGTGIHTVQVLEVGTANVLVTLDVISGRNVGSLVNIPAFAANSQKHYKLQAKSTIAADDPIFEGARVYLK